MNSLLFHIHETGRHHQGFNLRPNTQLIPELCRSSIHEVQPVLQVWAFTQGRITSRQRIRFKLVHFAPPSPQLEIVEDHREEARPVFDVTPHAPSVDEVEGFGEVPVCFYVVDVEFDIGRDPGRLDWRKICSDDLGTECSGQQLE